MRKAMIFFVLGLILLATNLAVVQKEQLRASGEVVRLALAPVDPRALMQGDYMALNYALNNRLDVKEMPAHRRLIVTLDARRIATAVEWDRGQPLAARQVYLLAHRGNQGISVASDGWYFQEGQAQSWSQARYGELRVAKDGSALLVALLNDQLKPLSAAP